MFMSVENVHFHYPVKQGETAGAVVQNVSFSVSRGEYIAIIGHNGSGKSTLAKLLGGLLSPTEGMVRIFGMGGVEATHPEDVRSQVGIVFQNPDNQMVATVVEEDIAFGLENRSVPRQEMVERVNDALMAVGMLEHRHRPPHQLSGGQKQRIAIAAVMAMGPECVIFDEATSMLDVQGRQDVLKLMDDLHRDGKVIITITHHMNEALRADRVIVMDGGRIVMDGTPREVFTQIEKLRSLKLDVPIASDMAHRLHITDVLTNEELAQFIAKESYSSVTIEPGPMSAQTKPSDRVSGLSGASPILRTDHLSHRYMPKTPMERTALHALSLSIEPGEIVAIVGHTGSGKSTLVQHFNGLIEPQEGQVIVDGMSVGRKKSDLRKIRQTVGLVFQSPEEQLFETLIGDDIAYGPFQYGASVDEARNRVKEAMEIVSLDFSWRDRPVQRLSGGQKRKVAIAGVIALAPKVLVLDEPTAGLDPKSRDELLQSIEALNREHGTTIVIVTHQMEEVARLVNRVFVLSHGELVKEAEPRQLFADRAFLKAYALGVPESLELFDELSLRGVPVRGVPLTRDELFHTLQSLLSKEADSGIV